MSSGSRPTQKKPAGKKPSGPDGRGGKKTPSSKSSPFLDLGITGVSAQSTAAPAASPGGARPASTLGFFSNKTNPVGSTGANRRPTTAAGHPQRTASATPLSGGAAVYESDGLSLVRDYEREQRLAELQRQVEEYRKDAENRKGAIARLRDENSRLRRSHVQAAGMSALLLSEKLSEALRLTVSPKAPAEEVAATVLEGVIRKVQESERLASQVTELKRNVEDMCNKLADEQTHAKSLRSELDDTKQSLSSKARETEEVKVKATASSEATYRHVSQVESLKQQLALLETRVQAAEESKARSEAEKAIAETRLSTLQSGTEDMEQQLALLSAESKEARQSADAWRGKNDKRIRTVTGCLALADTATDEEIMEKVYSLTATGTALTEENRTLKANLSTLEMEMKANRETIMRLVTDAGTHHKSSSFQAEELQRLEQERKQAAAHTQYLETECRLLRDQLKTGEDRTRVAMETSARKDKQIAALESSILELEEAKARRDVAISEMNSRVAAAVTRSGVGKPVSESRRADERRLAGLLQTLTADLEAEKQRTAALHDELNSLHEELDERQQEGSTIREELDDLHGQVDEHNDRQDLYESQLKLKDVTCKSLESEHAQHSHFCQRLSQLLKLDRLTKDFGSGMQTEAIMGRVDQLARQETDILAEKAAAVYNLQRKLKSTRTNLESKELHIEMMKKKMATLEHRALEMDNLTAERVAALAKLEKAERAKEKQATSIQGLRNNIQELKSALGAAEAFKETCLQQATIIENLQQQSALLTESNAKQSKKLTAKQRTLEAAQTKAESDEQRLDDERRTLQTELTAAQSALAEVRSREQQLLKMRSAIATLMGLEISSLSIPDYEIMARLEQLVKSHESHVATARGVQSALQQLQHSFYSGVDQAMNLAGGNNVVGGDVTTMSSVPSLQGLGSGLSYSGPLPASTYSQQPPLP